MLKCKVCLTVILIILSIFFVSWVYGQEKQEVIIKKEIKSPVEPAEKEIEIEINKEKFQLDEIEEMEELEDILEDIKELDPAERKIYIKKFMVDKPMKPGLPKKPLKEGKIHKDWHDSYMAKDRPFHKFGKEEWPDNYRKDNYGMYNKNLCGPRTHLCRGSESRRCESIHWILIIGLCSIIVFLMIIIIILLIIIIVVLFSIKIKKK